MFSWVAEQERVRISERTKAGLQKLKDKGVKLGRPNNETKIPDTIKAQIIQRFKEGRWPAKIAKEVGLSKYTVKRFLESRGLIVKPAP